MDLNDQQQKELWEREYPDDKIPGTYEPVEGKCGAKVRDKRLKDMGLTRFCGKTSGYGTDHFGEGTCKFHLGSTAKHTKSAVKEKMGKELATLSERLGEADPIGPPEIEAWLLAAKMKQWSLLMEEKLDELNEEMNTVDRAGVEHTRALIEIVERAWERFQGALEFMMKYDLRKRVLELEERQAQMVGAAFMAIILSQELRLTEQQIEVARSLFSSKMIEIGPALEPSWAVEIVDPADV
jgi:hypothetical protein